MNSCKNDHKNQVFTGAQEMKSLTEELECITPAMRNLTV